MHKDHKGFSLLEGLLVILSLCVVGAVGLFVWHRKYHTPTATTQHPITTNCANEKELTQACANQNNPVSQNKDGSIQIWDTGSTNTLGWQLIVNKDGSGKLVYDQPSSAAEKINYRSTDLSPKSFPKGYFDQAKVRTLLSSFGDITNLGAGSCTKPASFGYGIYMTFNGKTSQDISCDFSFTPIAKDPTVNGILSELYALTKKASPITSFN